MSFGCRRAFPFLDCGVFVSSLSLSLSLHTPAVYTEEGGATHTQALHSVESFEN